MSLPPEGASQTSRFPTKLPAVLFLNKLFNTMTEDIVEVESSSRPPLLLAADFIFGDSWNGILSHSTLPSMDLF